MKNLFADIPDELPRELCQSLLAAAAVRIERIVSRGHASSANFWYDQPQHEWVILLKGAARLLFEDDAQPLEMKPGDFVHIPAHRRHRVEWTDPHQQCVWLAVHYAD